MKSLIPWGQSRRNATPARRGDWLDRMWEGPFDSLLPFRGPTLTSRMPSVDVSEGEKEVKVRMEIPGMTEKDIDLTWHDGVLRIRGEKNDEKEEKKKGRYYRECSYGSFCRDVALGKSVDCGKAKAKYKNGVLTVMFPKIESARKAIEVKVD